MPVMDGFSFLKELQNKTISNYKNQPVIAVTGRNLIDLEHYQNSGFTTVIRKPYTPKTVLATIKAILDNSEIPAVLPVMSHPKNTTKTYTLKPLKLFLSDDKDALKEILESFMTNTIESLNELEQAATENNFEEIKNIAHKMNPMFKQIEAMDISTILDQLELEDLSSDKIKKAVSDLKSKITALFVHLEKEKN